MEIDKEDIMETNRLLGEIVKSLNKIADYLPGLE